MSQSVLSAYWGYFLSFFWGGVTFHGWGKVGEGQEVRGMVTWERSMHRAMMRPHHTIS